MPEPGDWGGSSSTPTAQGSIDHAVIEYAGGSVRDSRRLRLISTRSKFSRPPSRIANTLFLDNASGDSSGDAIRPERPAVDRRGHDLRARRAAGDRRQSRSSTTPATSSASTPMRSTTSSSPTGATARALSNAVAVGYDKHGPLIAGNTISRQRHQRHGGPRRSRSPRRPSGTTPISCTSSPATINDIINQHTFGGIRSRAMPPPAWS